MSTIHALLGAGFTVSTWPSWSAADVVCVVNRALATVKPVTGIVDVAFAWSRSRTRISVRAAAVAFSCETVLCAPPGAHAAKKRLLTAAR
jgi:hypothetical protein